MEANTDAIVGIESLRTEFDLVKSKVEEYGKVIIFEDNKPTYILSGINIQTSMNISLKRAKMNLWDAMEQVLLDKPNNMMHAKDLAKEITDRELYFMKDGSPVKTGQITTRVSHKPDRFESLSGNFVKLIRLPK